MNNQSIRKVPPIDFLSIVNMGKSRMRARKGSGQRRKFDLTESEKSHYVKRLFSGETQESIADEISEKYSCCRTTGIYKLKDAVKEYSGKND